MSRPENPRFPHACTITRVISNGPLVDDGEELLVYEGPCRVYDKNTTSDKGEVITSNRGLSLPLARQDWQALGLFPHEGDVVIVDRGGYEERGIVIDVNPANFRGTHIIWNYDRQ